MRNVPTPYGKGRLAVLALALLLALSGCGPAPSGGQAEPQETPAVPERSEEPEAERGGEEDSPFTLGYYTQLGLNPYTCTNTTNRAVIALLYEPLFQVDPAFETEPVLAISCVPGEGGDWSLTLREDVSFWNGETLTAEDVAASLETARKPGSIYESRLAPMGELTQTGEYTLSFTWSQPLGDLSVLLEIPIVQAGTENAALPMGTGGYLPELGDEGVETLLTNPSWWRQETLPVAEIPLYGVEGSDLLIYGFESGAVTLVSSDLTSSNSLGYSGSYEVWDYPTSNLLYLGCNTQSGICQNRDFRLALQSALDRETIAQRLLSGHAVASPLTFHPDSDLYDEALAQSLTQSGPAALEDYRGQTVAILVNADSSFKTAIAGFLADSLKEAGLEAEVQALSWPGYSQALEDGEYDLYLGEVRLEPNFDLTPFFDLNGSLNFRSFRTDEISSALAAYLAAGQESRANRAYALSLALSQEAPILPLCFEEHSILCNWGTLSAYAATQSNLFYHIQDWDLGSESPID